MRERPILFSAPMVRANLRDVDPKTQTRRICKLEVRAGMSEPEWASLMRCCPYGQPGDRLWVRESWAYNPDHPGVASRACFMADPEHEHDGLRWKPSIHMPRAVCRIVLEVTAVRVERLQDISEVDAIAEGIELSHVDMLNRKQWRMLPHRDGDPGPDGEVVVYAGPAFTSRPIEAYRSLWLSINGPGSWAANPWVWVVEFRRIDGRP